MGFVKAYCRDEGGLTIVYEDEKADRTVYQRGSRSWRTSNPGNIAKGGYADRHGAIGDDGANAIFPDCSTGRAALEALLRDASYSSRTIPAAMKCYAPAPENDPAAYSAFILKETGLEPDRKVSSLTPAEFGKFLAAIQIFEGWKEGKVTRKG